MHQIIMNTSANRLKQLPKFPFVILKLIQEYDNSPQNINTFIMCGDYTQEVPLSVRPYGHMIIRQFSKFVEIYDWTNESSELHLKNNSIHRFIRFEILNCCEIVLQTRKGSLLLYNFLTKTLSKIFCGSNYNFVILPHDKVFVLMEHQYILINVRSRRKIITTFEFFAHKSEDKILLKSCLFRQSFKIKNGYIFQVYDSRHRLHFVLQWNISENKWKKCLESTCMNQLTRNLFKSCNFDYNWKQISFQCIEKQQWCYRSCDDEVFEIDPNRKSNKTSQLFLDYKPSNTCFCDNSNIFRFYEEFQSCSIYA